MGHPVYDMPKLKVSVPGYETIPTVAGSWRLFGPPTPRRATRFEVARQPRLRLVRFLEPGDTLRSEYAENRHLTFRRGHGAAAQTLLPTGQLVDGRAGKLSELFTGAASAGPGTVALAHQDRL